MTINLNKYLAFLCVFGLTIALHASFAFASDGQVDFIETLKDEFNNTKSEYKQVLDSIRDTEERLKFFGEEKVTLSKQLINLQDQISDSEKRLTLATVELSNVENEIIEVENELEMKEVALEYQKKVLKDYLKVIYEQENSYFAFDENGDINAFKLLLADGNVGDNLKNIEYFNLLNEAGIQIVQRLAAISSEMEVYQRSLEDKYNFVSDLQGALDDENRQLVLQKNAKENLLNLTLGQERIYSELLNTSKAEEEQILDDVKEMSSKVAFIQQKALEDGDSFDPENYRNVLDDRTISLYNLNLLPLSNEGGLFSWPVPPTRGISAYFRDSGYKAVFGVGHNAVDIPIYQGSPVHAASDGVVYKTRDNSYGYSYVILAHSGGFTSVYGHVSDILVDEGDYVSSGTIIALSGGMPGTKGAGYMTTGPHMHFELLKNGAHVDPLDYLPLSALSESLLGRLPAKYLEKWEQSVYGFVIDKVLR